MGTLSYFDDFSSVVSFVVRNLRMILTNFYENPRFNFLFNMALLPVILMFAFDILMSFILSFSSKRIVLFNVFSVRSWQSISTAKNQNRLKVDSNNVKYIALSGVSRRSLHNFRTKSTKSKNTKSFVGKVFKKNYADWRDGVPKLLEYNNMYSRQTYYELREIRKNMNSSKGNENSSK